MSQANAGPAAARNTGISATTGPFVSFLDADDLWLPTYLAQMGRALTSSPEAAVAFTDAWVWDENVGRFGRRKIMAMVDPPEVVPRDSIELFRELVARNFFYVSTTVRRSVLEHVGGFDETVRGSEDWELWLRIASSGYPAVRAAPVLAVYRVQAGSISSDRSAMHEAMIQTLRKAATYSSEAVVHERKVDAQGRAYATGKRKNAVARVWIKPGSGKIVVNTKTIEVFFARPVLRMLINQPLVAANRATQYDIVCTVSGGGLSGQAGAVRHGLAKALTYFEPDLRGALKRGGFLTRDSRVVERKKYGRAKARRSFQFSKR